MLVFLLVCRFEINNQCCVKSVFFLFKTLQSFQDNAGQNLIISLIYFFCNSNLCRTNLFFFSFIICLCGHIHHIDVHHKGLHALYEQSNGAPRYYISAMVTHAIKLNFCTSCASAFSNLLNFIWSAICCINLFWFPHAFTLHLIRETYRWENIHIHL